MCTQPQTPARMSVDEFLAWAERAAHWEKKPATHVALPAAVRAKGLPCHVVPDGATVRIDETTAYEPDAMVY